MMLPIRLRFAGYDMTKARKEGYIYITGTQQGTVMLDYDFINKLYKVTTLSGALLFEGKAGEAKVFVAGLYIINES